MDKIKKLYDQYKEVILYIVFGGLTTLVNIVGYALCARVFHWETMVANGIALTASILFAYVTNKIYVFENKTETLSALVREFLTFIGCRIATGALDMGIMYVSVDIFGWNDLIMKITANVIVIVLNFIFSKLIIFTGK